MMNSKKIEIFPPEDFYCVRAKNEIPEAIAEMMKELTESPYCKGKIPVLHIGGGNNDLLIIKRKPFVTLLNRLAAEHDPERLLATMAARK